MSIIAGLLYPNVSLRKERVDEYTPYGLLKIAIDVLGYKRVIAIRDKRTWPYLVDGSTSMMPIPVGVMTFRAWEMSMWKPANTSGER